MPSGHFNAHMISLKIPIRRALGRNSRDLEFAPCFPLTYKQCKLNFWCLLLQLNHLFILSRLAGSVAYKGSENCKGATWWQAGAPWADHSLIQLSSLLEWLWCHDRFLNQYTYKTAISYSSVKGTSNVQLVSHTNVLCLSAFLVWTMCYGNITLGLFRRTLRLCTETFSYVDEQGQFWHR